MDGLTAGNLAVAQGYASDATAPPPRASQSHIRSLPALPPAPDHIDALGLPERFVEDLTIKTLYRIATPTPLGIANAMRIHPAIVRETLEDLKRQRLVETTSASGRLESEWQYRLTDMGAHEAESAFARSRYVGPVPVPIQDYFRALEYDNEVGAPD
ncbi:MAG: hypothetical protein M0R74_04295, partial [Dehalococcoidia bacterium]|nr:hypothetical protein [Dehalococcoidia bacterium]